MPKSRVADKPVIVPKDVQITFENNVVTVKGKNGELFLSMLPSVNLDIKEGHIDVTENENTMKRASDKKQLTALRGTYAALIRNMIKGVTVGFSKELEIVGIGYRAAMQGEKLVVSVGYSNPVEYVAPKGIKLEVPAPNKIVIKGNDKYLVGEVTAIIRKFRQPNSYSGKGIKYANEVIIKKEGKKV
ncbi:MAG TPA: 50S ribosomal protein L6 [Petrotogaceae bacterium]|nr:50S ribosomal protein L6 [Petrotogaceae bacterium]